MWRTACTKVSECVEKSYPEFEQTDIFTDYRSVHWFLVTCTQTEQDLTTTVKLILFVGLLLSLDPIAYFFPCSAVLSSYQTHQLSIFLKVQFLQSNVVTIWLRQSVLFQELKVIIKLTIIKLQLLKWVKR